uniref:CX domain-containing protein n=1 Tax=Globodera rostochiensis TaxID=31243 RepID=A0A914H3G0_GLORO
MDQVKIRWTFVRVLLLFLTVRCNWHEPGMTRSLTGSYATKGSNETTATVLTLMKVGLLEGYAVRRIKMFNDRVFLSRYRRSYWFGTRYYALDNNYFLDTREACAYRMRGDERSELEYEEQPEEPVLDIVFQCQKYAQYCCGLDCCNRY